MLAEYEETVKFYEQKVKTLESDNTSLLATLHEKESEATTTLLEFQEEHRKSQVTSPHSSSIILLVCGEPQV
jgi:prefoldin subunit 5